MSNNNVQSSPEQKIHSLNGSPLSPANNQLEESTNEQKQVPQEGGSYIVINNHASQAVPISNAQQRQIELER
jgi:hypothetical protein